MYNLTNNRIFNYYYNLPVKNLRFLLPILVLFLPNPIFGQWNTQSPVPTHLEIHGVAAPLVNRVFLATDDNSFDNGGSLFESTDGGITWTQRNVPVSLGSPFNGIFFLDSQNGWVFGNENYRTTDGGTNWTQLPVLGSIYYMKFYNQTFGIATNNIDRFVSYDGGNNWEISPFGIFNFDFFDETTGLGIAQDGIYRTTDSGVSFLQVETGDAKSVVYLSNDLSLSIVDNSVLRSTDGGITWNNITSANEKSNLIKVSQSVALAWGRTGSFPNYNDNIFRSTDGGLTWTDLGEPIPAGIFAFTVKDNQTVVAADLDGNLHLSSDAGLSWTQTFTSPGPRPNFLSSASPNFADSQTGYFGFGGGFVIKTTDGGVSWSQISSGIGETLNDIDRFENGTMIAVGDNGTLLTSNGSSPWILHDRISFNNLNGIHIINSTDVVVIDEAGQVYKSTDNGMTWSQLGTPPPNLDGEDLHFTSLTDGWVIGGGSIGNVLFHTTDAGNSWTPAQGFGGSYRKIDFEGSNGWALNVGAVYYQSSDNGNTWVQKELPGFPFQISDMEFYDENTGYAVGWGGYAARSNDGGLTWEELQTPNTDHQFTDIFVIGANEFWLSTNDDAVYYSGNGGQNWAILNINSEGFGSFSGIAASPQGDAWTVGFQGYIEHFSGPPPPPLNNPPEASFTFEANGLTVDFTDESFDTDGFIVSWFWDFDDSTFSNLQNPTHTFTEANTYIVRLTVTDDDGATGTAGRIVTVQPNPGGIFGDFTEVTPLDSLFVTPQDEDFWVITTAPADYDNDGDLDMAVLGYYVVYNVSVEDKLVLIRNEGPANEQEWEFSYIDVPFSNFSSGSSDMAWGDVDGDFDMDLVVGTDGNTVLYRNDSGTLVLSDTELPSYWEDNDQADFDLRSITWADFDNDGDQDLLIPSVFDNSTFTYRTALMRNDSSNGTGGWVFTEIDSVFAPTTHAQSFWADFDGDQDLDLLLVNIAPLTDEGFIRRYRNDGNGVFVGEDILGYLSIEHGEVQWGDYDADGDLDILVAGNVREIDSTYTHMALRVYKNENNNFIREDVIPCIPCEGWFDITAATWADYDSDGDIDILLAGTHNPGTGHIEGRATIYINDGTGIFTKTDNELPAPRASGSRGGTFSWFDLDGEGDLDYFIAGQYFVPGGNGLVEAQMHVYRNDAEGQNEAPTIPTGLTAEIEAENNVRLSWIPSSDDHTESIALTYDLVVVRKGTHIPIGKTSVTSGDTLVRLPEPGNISAVNEWYISSLPDGEYTWIVQAVDAAYVGSPIAMGEFYIGILSSNQTGEKLPYEYSLGQNYPNPFNPVTKIVYAIPKEGLVTMKVYNLIGEEVTTLVNAFKQAGNYEVTFNAAKLASGVYFYRIHSGDFKQVKKMIINK